MTQSESLRRDRHNPDNVQFKAWVPATLHTDFFKACAIAGLVPSAVVRAMLEDLCTAVIRQERKNG